jgi:glycosyltransferase involved in cell wall biosynthesis
MKLVINAASAKMGGNANYITQLLRNLATLVSPAEVVVLLPPETYARQQSLAEKVRCIPVDIGRVNWLRRVWWEQVSLRRFLHQEKADALFSSGNFGMLKCPVPQILLVRNSVYFSKIYLSTVGEQLPLTSKIAFRLRRWLITQSVRNSDIVMTPTQAMLDELRQFVDVAPQKVLVNPYGTTAPECPTATNWNSGGPVRLLFVSVYYEHKNLSTLLKANALLNKDSSRSFFLTTTAGPSRDTASLAKTYQEDQALAARPEISKWVEFKGLLLSEEAWKLYGEADVFVFPSLTESFGQPLAEAMSHGLPIVAADTPVNREICADAAVYFQTFDPEDLAAKIREVADNENLRRQLSEAGRRRAATRFRWEDHARRLVEAFNRLMPGGAHRG